MANGFDYPVYYETQNFINGKISNSEVHCKSSYIFKYYAKYLMMKSQAAIIFDGVPDTWDYDYFINTLYNAGVVCIFNTDKYGIIPQQCSLTGYNIYYRPTHCIVTNPLIKSDVKLKIGENCEIIKMQNDYSGIRDIISYYSDLMGMCIETAVINLFNSKTSFIFTADSKATSESIKKMYDNISAGAPMVVVDENLQRSGKIPAEMLTQNVGGSYIADRVLCDLKKIEQMFETEIGIANSNTDKKERLITDEVNSNNQSTSAKLDLWIDNINRCLERVNKMFGLSISCRRRYNTYDNINSKPI